MTRLIVIRHGRTAWNCEERFRGRTDLPLDSLGEKQVHACGKAVAARFRPVAVYSSPLQRTLSADDRRFTLETLNDTCHLTRTHPQEEKTR